MWLCLMDVFMPEKKENTCIYVYEEMHISPLWTDGS